MLAVNRAPGEGGGESFPGSAHCYLQAEAIAEAVIADVAPGSCGFT